MFSVLLAQHRWDLGVITSIGNILNLDPGAPSQLRTVFNRGISFLIAFLTVLAGLFFLFQIFIGALGWLNAGGNESNVASARQRIMQALIGLAIVVAAYGIIALVGALLGLSILNPLGEFTSGTGSPAPACSTIGCSGPGDTVCSDNGCGACNPTFHCS